MERTLDETPPAAWTSELLILWLLLALAAPVIGVFAGSLAHTVVAGTEPLLPQYRANVDAEDEEYRRRIRENREWKLRGDRARFITWGLVSLFGLAAAVKAGVIYGRGSTSPKAQVVIETLMFILIVVEYTLLAPFMFFAWIFRGG